MADTLLHITLAQTLLQDGCDETKRLHPSVQKTLKENFDDYCMGSALFDLPYYDNLPLTGLHTFQKKPLIYHPFGQLIHDTNVKQLCMAVIQNAASPTEFSLAAGALTHFAVDIVFHKEIESQIKQLPVSHDTLEREMGLHCHFDLLGHSGIGTPYAQRSCFIFPHAGWERFVATTIKQVHPCAPDAQTFKKWQRNFRVFGFLHAKPYYPWLKTIAGDDDNLARLSLSLMEESLQTAVPLVNDAYHLYKNEITPHDFSQTMPSVRMSDGLPETKIL